MGRAKYIKGRVGSYHCHACGKTYTYRKRWADHICPGNNPEWVRSSTEMRRRARMLLGSERASEFVGQAKRIGNEVAALRRIKGLTSDQMATITTWTQSEVSRIERGQSLVLVRMIAMFDALGLEVSLRPKGSGEAPRALA